jgi:ABC-type lipoprotein export system ATPase subunit/ABC-type antimicrobial peptide transport system permease subunit
MGAVASVDELVKNYYMEEVIVPALRGVSLTFAEGDFIALMGPSGSGKSTLLNLLGCLDRATNGRYFLGGEDVSEMDDDQLSEVRSRYIGFIFQSYNLLPQYTVVENIEIPLLYQGCRLNDETRQRCIALAELVGLGDRLDHRPTQLSGGQQQRVAIARSLVNDPHIILADEPTGNLDTQTSDEIMRLLRKLNEAGKTIIMVTHETDIDAWARRAVRMRDGHIESDVRHDARQPARAASLEAVALPALFAAPGGNRPAPAQQDAEVRDLALANGEVPVGLPLAPATGSSAPSERQAVLPTAPEAAPSSPAAPPGSTSLLGSLLAYFASAWVKGRSGFILALRSLWLHKLRAVLSVLGIIIGTAAVIALMAFGKGSMEDALADIRRQGTTNIIVKSVKPVDDANNQRRSWVAKYGLTWEDLDGFKFLDSVVGSVPMRIFPQEVRHLDKICNARLVATTEDYKRINQFDMALGRFLVDGLDQIDEGDDKRFRTVVVLGSRVAEDLFPFEDPLGQTIVLNKEQYVVIGVIKDRMPRGSSAMGQAAEDFNRDIYIPVQTCKTRFGERVIIRQGGGRTGEQVQLHQVTLTVSDIDKVRSTGELVRNLLERNHQRKDWEVHVPLDRLEEAERARDRYNMLLVLIASISLVVGGIGIMNIMLATVTERTREIGIRRALGAKRRDITTQFIIEAVVQTGIGGLLGIAVGLVIVFGVPLLSRLFIRAALPVQLDVRSIFLALAVAVGVGVLFGWYPARRASLLDPIEALRHN